MNEDLPDDLMSTPVTPQTYADVVAHLVPEEDRVRGCVVLILIGADGLIRQPVLIEDAGPDDARHCGDFLAQLATLLAETDTFVLFARGRGGAAYLAHSDVWWERTLTEHLGDRVLAGYLAVPGEVCNLADFPRDLPETG
ncbi:hypothetical protein G9U51_03185 [Calidifontibacter sp. DB0510]|uniref:Uncharacterized protein n=1 Tax=Metallococcus carri TaxID=1656884 RepID=A0A967AXG8_9MICO|nr:hypothetical protein [Metallococcus carri]NHN54786.1 hypothetical protein [Metallococcus carri]NOP37131.1 hypothetical protein [Calidifontibacter sp. DB2511S]